MRIKKLIKDMTPDSVVQIRKWRKAHGAFPRIFRPVTFSEKVLHRNLFERRDAFTQIADKAAVRSYVERRLGPEILPKLYHLTGDPNTIPFDELPPRFVVKPTHGSGWVRVVTDKSTLDRAALIATCADWLKRSYYRESREIVYKDVEPRILVEEFIDDVISRSFFFLQDIAAVHHQRLPGNIRGVTRSQKTYRCGNFVGRPGASDRRVHPGDAFGFGGGRGRDPPRRNGVNRDP
jgi:hypothetical protein